MKRILLIIIFLAAVPLQSQARDYLVEFVGEHYREQQNGSDPRKKIYHTLQVDSALGSKLLILKGDDNRYRAWLRNYLADHTKLIVTVPDSEDTVFRKAKAYEIDATAIHPVYGNFWKEVETGMEFVPAYHGEKQILVVDDNIDRRNLLEMIIKDLGHPVSVSGDGLAAWKMFRIQPDKYIMVITDNRVPGMTGADLAKKISKADPGMPVIIGTEYKARDEENLLRIFAGSDTIVVKPVILRELTRTIADLLGKNV